MVPCGVLDIPYRCWTRPGWWLQINQIEDVALSHWQGSFSWDFEPFGSPDSKWPKPIFGLVLFGGAVCTASLSFGVWGLGFGAWGLGLSKWGPGFRI